MDSAAWETTLARLDAHAGIRISSSVAPLLMAQPDPVTAAARFDAWLGALASPGSIAQHIQSEPQSAALLIRCLGHSSHISRILVQNSEYGMILLDPGEVASPITRERLERSGRSQMAQAVSYTHRLDRIRCLKQEALVRIAALEYAGVSTAEDVWIQLSATADACLTLAHEACWEDYCFSRGIELAPKMAVVGMGKLGGSELNTSSDVDLVFLLPDDSTDEDLTHAARFASKYIRALSDSMGRGALYRVDMRLRPFGRSGDLVSRFRTISNYLENYAEAWEHLALIRSRMIVGPPDLAHEWEAMRRRICFAKGRADWQVQEILEMRQRIEGICSPNDIKRASGGIRDVEFTAQLLQLVFGYSAPDLQQKETLPTLKALCSHALIPCEAEEEMREGLLLLRLVEHHLQMEGDQQTHELPPSHQKQSLLAAACGDEKWEDLKSRIDETRLRLRHWHKTLVGSSGSQESASGRRGELTVQSPEAVQWLDAMPDSESIWLAISENESSFQRVALTAERAPVLLSDLKTSPGITEQIISGEVLEPPPIVNRVSGQRLGMAKLRAAARTALLEGETFFADWTETVERSLRLLMQETAPDLTLLALGSLSEGQLGLSSDADLMLMAQRPSDKADRQARAFMARLSDLRQEGSPLEADFRLRPEGRQGPIYVHPESLRRYVTTRMEPWERIAFSRRRLLFGDSSLADVLDHHVLDRPFTREDAESLHHIKTRVESERADRKAGCLDVKLGPGGMDDILWLHHLQALRMGWRQKDRRLRDLTPMMVSHGLISQSEADSIHQAWTLWNKVRLRMSLCGIESHLWELSGDKLKVTQEGQDPNGLASLVRRLLERLWVELLEP